MTTPLVIATATRFYPERPTANSAVYFATLLAGHRPAPTVLVPSSAREQHVVKLDSGVVVRATAAIRPSSTYRAPLPARFDGPTSQRELYGILGEIEPAQVVAFDLQGDADALKIIALSMTNSVVVAHDPNQLSGGRMGRMRASFFALLGVDASHPLRFVTTNEEARKDLIRLELNNRIPSRGITPIPDPPVHQYPLLDERVAKAAAELFKTLPTSELVTRTTRHHDGSLLM